MKPFVVSTLALTVEAGMPWFSTNSLSSLNGVGCGLCVRAGQTYCTQNAVPYYHGGTSTPVSDVNTADADQCCKDKTYANCPKLYEADMVTLKPAYKCYNKAVDDQLGVLKCPQQANVCDGGPAGLS